MGRPRKRIDASFAAHVRAYLADKELSQSDLATIIGVNKSTMCRSLADEAFSESLRNKLSNVIRTDPEWKEDQEGALHKALRLLSEVNTLHSIAQRLIEQALDHGSRTE